MRKSRHSIAKNKIRIVIKCKKKNLFVVSALSKCKNRVFMQTGIKVFVIMEGRSKFYILKKQLPIRTGRSTFDPDLVERSCTELYKRSFL